VEWRDRGPEMQSANCKMEPGVREEGKFGSGHSTGRGSLLHAPIYHNRLLEALERKGGFWASRFLAFERKVTQRTQRQNSEEHRA
jgi:hypothetical protein